MEQNNERVLEFLVIDDDPSNIEAIAGLLESEGIKLTTAADGQEGIETYCRKYDQGSPYDIVLTDFKMPRATGLQVTAAIKRLNQKTPVYVMTGNVPDLENDLRHVHKNIRPDGVLEKPFIFDAISKIICDIRAGVKGTSKPQS